MYLFFVYFPFFVFRNDDHGRRMKINLLILLGMSDECDKEKKKKKILKSKFINNKNIHAIYTMLEILQNELSHILLKFYKFSRKLLLWLINKILLVSIAKQKILKCFFSFVF